jgi:plasmid stabilization system protein ParE
MIYELSHSDVAVMEIEEVFLWIFARDPTRAFTWQQGLDRSLLSLSEFPERCPLAYENQFAPYEIRQHSYGVYRILFTLLDSDDNGVNDTVRVLHVRHGAREYLQPDNF